MSNDAWWEAQRRLHGRLQIANDISDDEARKNAQKLAWDMYNDELRRATDN